MIGNVIEFALKTLASAAFVLALYFGALYYVCVRPDKEGRRDRSERREYTPSRLRMTWWLAQGVPAHWVRDRQWRNPWLFEQVPWECFVCRREYLPGDGVLALWARFGFRNKDTGKFIPYDDDDEWLGTLHYAPAWYCEALNQWWDHPGYANDTVVYAHSWHFQPTDRFVSMIADSLEIVDTHTGQVYERRNTPAWLETLTYAARWIRAQVRGVVHFPLFLFRAAWAWAYALDRSLVRLFRRVPVSLVLYDILYGMPRSKDWARQARWDNLRLQAAWGLFRERFPCARWRACWNEVAWMEEMPEDVYFLKEGIDI